MNILLDKQGQIDFSKTFNYRFNNDTEINNTIAQLNPVIETDNKPNTSFTTESFDNLNLRDIQVIPASDLRDKALIQNSTFDWLEQGASLEKPIQERLQEIVKLDALKIDKSTDISEIKGYKDKLEEAKQTIKEGISNHGRLGGDLNLLRANQKLISLEKQYSEELESLIKDKDSNETERSELEKLKLKTNNNSVNGSNEADNDLNQDLGENGKLRNIHQTRAAHTTGHGTTHLNPSRTVRASDIRNHHTNRDHNIRGQHLESYDFTLYGENGQGWNGAGQYSPADFKVLSVGGDNTNPFTIQFVSGEHAGEIVRFRHSKNINAELKAAMKTGEILAAGTKLAEQSDAGSPGSVHTHIDAQDKDTVAYFINANMQGKYITYLDTNSNIAENH